MKGLFTSLAISSSLLLAGCNLTDEEKEKLDNAATDLEKLADQIIITSPAKDSVVNDSIVTVRADIPADANAKEVALYVDGIEIAKDTDGAPWEIQWPAYYYADGNKHTLLLKTITGSGNEVRNNEQFQLTVAESANQALAFSDGVDGTQIQDQNQLEVSFNDFPTATRYEVSDGVQTVETTSTTATFTGLDVGSYSLRYRAIFDYSASTTLTGPWSASTQIEVLPPQLPAINDPVVVKNEFGYELTFSWEPIAEGDTYSISLRKSGQIESQIILSNANDELVLPDMEMGMYTWSLVRTNSLAQTVQSEINELGIGVFKTQLGGSRNDRASQIIKSRSGGYIVRAETSSYEITSTLQGTSDDWIIRLDEEGNLVDEYIENKDGRNRFRNMLEASDGSIYLVGHDWESDKALIVKLDKNLDKVWDSETLYRPVELSSLYSFSSVVEWIGKIYVGAEEWAESENSTYLVQAHLHEVNPSTGSVADAIALPATPDMTMKSIKSIIPRIDGNLALVGYGEEKNSDTYFKEGAFVLTLDSTLSEVSTWDNTGDIRHSGVGDAIELNSGRIAVIGHNHIGGPAISTLNSNAVEHRYYLSTDYYYASTNLAELSDGDLLVFLREYDGNSLLIQSFNENLIPSPTKQLKISGSDTPYGLIANSDDSITLLYGQTQSGYSNDVIIQKIPSISK